MKSICRFRSAAASGYWGYDLKNFVEPRLPRTAVNDLELPDCQTGFYDSLVVFDHRIDEVWIISTGLQADGSRDAARARAQLEFWESHLQADPGRAENRRIRPRPRVGPVTSNLSRAEFIAKVRARPAITSGPGTFIRSNLSHRLTAEPDLSGWEFFQRLCDVSPAPFCGLSGLRGFSGLLLVARTFSAPERRANSNPAHQRHPPARPATPTRDAQLTYELQTSAKEMAELVMITDLLRNDLGKVCEYGSVQVPELVRLERYAHVQHLVSTVAGRLRGDADAFFRLRLVLSGRQRDRRAENSRDGDH